MIERERSTPELLLGTAERLFAEHGVGAISSRRVAEEAGAANNSAVRYHFGAKDDLVLAIVRRHSVEIDKIRRELLDEAGDSAGPRDYLACLVLPVTEHLARQRPPTWFARFLVQVRSDPVLREPANTVWNDSPARAEAIAKLRESVSDIDWDILQRRSDLVEPLVTQTCTDYERKLSGRSHRAARAEWASAGQFLLDAVVGLLLAPVTAASN
ncbi:MAG: TetR/AcrR family transcriptional regulator [Sphaerisporangium sp.]|nr:TetR/AcrR family transcriptional regulator [Sphaerisporangium sp.]